MEVRRDELADAITKLRERVPDDMHPVLDALTEDSEEGSSADAVWSQLIENALNEA